MSSGGGSSYPPRFSPERQTAEDMQRLRMLYKGDANTAVIKAGLPGGHDIEGAVRRAEGGRPWWWKRDGQLLETEELASLANSVRTVKRLVDRPENLDALVDPVHFRCRDACPDDVEVENIGVGEWRGIDVVSDGRVVGAR